MTWTDLATLVYEYRIGLIRTVMLSGQLIVVWYARRIYQQGREAMQRLLALKTARTQSIEETESAADKLSAMVDSLMEQHALLAKEVAEKAADVAHTVETSLRTLETDLKTNTQLTIAAGAASAAANDAANHVNDKLHAMAQGGVPVQVEVVNNPLVTTQAPAIPDHPRRRRDDHG